MSSSRPTRQLLLSALSVLQTLNAGRAVDRHGWPGILASTAVFRSELPLEAAAATAARLAWAARTGRLAGRTGRAAVALSAVSVAGLTFLHARAGQTPRVVDEALAELGLPPAPPAELASRVPLVLRSARARSRWVTSAPLSYGPYGRENLLDVWRRPDLPLDGRAPVLLQVPGGGWLRGDKQGQAYPLLSLLVEHGWVCVSISYRAAPRAPWPAQIVDAKRALVWVKQHIAEHGGDPSFIAVTGGSAGGHLSSMLALTAGDPLFQPGFEHEDTTVQAAVPLYGSYDWLDDDHLGNRELTRHVERTVVQRRRRDAEDVLRQGSTLYRVHGGAPPFLVVHGANDTLMPVEQGRALVASLRAVSRSEVGYLELPYAMHAFDLFGSRRTAAVVQGVLRFLEAVRSQALREGAQPS
ncbi:MAG: lipM [Frankiales bacterium]|nr:lipM [Frankiales bacterium]